MKQRNTTVRNAAVLLVIICLLQTACGQEQQIPYKQYTLTEEACFITLDQESMDRSYTVLDYEQYADFCESNSITDCYTDENSWYMLVCIKDWSLGIEHHEFEVMLKGNDVHIKDTYSWGATGDRYWLFLCIPVEEKDTSVVYTADFREENVN